MTKGRGIRRRLFPLLYPLDSMVSGSGLGCQAAKNGYEESLKSRHRQSFRPTSQFRSARTRRADMARQALPLPVGVMFPSTHTHIKPSGGMTLKQYRHLSQPFLLLTFEIRVSSDGTRPNHSRIWLCLIAYCIQIFRSLKDLLQLAFQEDTLSTSFEFSSKATPRCTVCSLPRPSSSISYCLSLLPKMGDASLPSSSALPPADAREALTSRTIPTMTLSSASNPLTTPLPPILASLSPSERALARFAITGNAIITGGAGTLALASGRALLEHGLTGLALLDLASTLKSSAAAIEKLERDFPGANIFTASVDVRDEVQVAEAMRSAAHGFRGSGIDILCCFAGVVGCVPSLDASASEWRRVIDVNQTGSFLCAQAAAKYMIATSSNALAEHPELAAGVRNSTRLGSSVGRTGSSILFISSISGHSVNYPQPQAAYNVSKAGVGHLTRCLAAEWAVHGIRVNCISPGYMDTVLNAGQSLGPVRDVWASRCPLGRMGDVEELTGAVVMLCGRRSGRYITGADVVIDGGAVCF